MQAWLKVPSSFLSKQDEVKITIYGPYGKFKKKLRDIARHLRDTHKFRNTWTVIDRNGFRQQNKGEQNEVYWMHKSYYYLENSDINIIVYYCFAYNQSADFEFKHLCDILSPKIQSSMIFRDSRCTMGSLLDGQIIDSQIRSQTFDGDPVKNPEQEIAALANGYCQNILKEIYFTI